MSDPVLKNLEGKRAQLSSDGYVIVRNVVPPEMLDRLRRDVDTIVARERAADPHWATTAQPRGSIGDRVDEQTIGGVQSLFLVSASVGMSLLAMLFPGGWERRFMVACPLIGVPLLAVWGWEGCPTWLLIAVLIPTGLVLWGTTPTMVSYAQQMFPRGAGMASAITMGLAWGVGGLIEAPFTTYFHDIGRPQLAVWAFLPFVGTAGLAALFLPDPDPDHDDPDSTDGSSRGVKADPVVEFREMMIHELFLKDELQLKDGYLDKSTAPGLGMALNDEKVEALRTPGMDV